MTYEDMIEVWTHKFRDMSEGDRDALRRAIFDFDRASREQERDRRMFGGTIAWRSDDDHPTTKVVAAPAFSVTLNDVTSNA